LFFVEYVFANVFANVFHCYNLTERLFGQQDSRTFPQIKGLHHVERIDRGHGMQSNQAEGF
jgi:hypothetical protein